MSCSLCSWHRAVKIARNISPVNQSINAVYSQYIRSRAMNASTRLISNKYKERISPLPFRLSRVPRRISALHEDQISLRQCMLRTEITQDIQINSLSFQSPFSSSRPSVARLLSLYSSLPSSVEQLEYARYARQICEGLRRTRRTHERQSARISSSNLFYRFCWE